MSRIVSAVNFKSGGKSSILRLMAEELQSPILNFDKNRDATLYNKIKTVNINEDATIKKINNTLVIDGRSLDKYDYLLCDFGGYHDGRIIHLESDLYIIPTFDDFETIRESIRMELYIRKLHTKKGIEEPNIVYVVNGAISGNNEKIAQKAISDLKKNLQKIKSNADIVFFPKNKLVRDLVNQNNTVSEVLDKYFLGRSTYKKVLSFAKDLKNRIDEI